MLEQRYAEYQAATGEAKAQALNVLLVAIQKRLRRLSRAFLREAYSEDFVQDILVKVWQRLVSGQFSGRSQLGTWIEKIVRTDFVYLLRKQGRAPEMVSLDSGGVLREAEKASLVEPSRVPFEDGPLRADEREILEGLQRGLTELEQAKELGLTRNQVQRRKRRVRKRLRGFR